MVLLNGLFQGHWGLIVNIKYLIFILPVLFTPKTAGVLLDGFSSLGTSFCMSAWPNSQPGGKLLDKVKSCLEVQTITRFLNGRLKKTNQKQTC